MPSLYHFNSDQFKENLMLGGQQHMVAGRLCQYLKGWQLDGIRFLYRHFEKGEACILNDESGLGKVVTVAVFLGAVLTNDTTKKCLIIVRDDEHIEGWRFHLSVLTQLTVKVIERTSDINYETVFLIKWSTLKNIGQITKVNFDHIIIDNRGEMLTNKFCTGILLRYYENKTSIVISSADVTADIKLLHILLRLCGRLDKQYTDVKIFEDKFQLPKLKDGVCSKVDLEDYFLKREKVINFCREFRLRRYSHQFDEEFPLVPSNEFKRYLEQWRSSENSQSSGSVKLLSSSSEKDIEELFQAYFQVKEERNNSKLDCEVQQITKNMAVNENEELDESDEVVVMSPLLLVSESESESDNEETQMQNEANNREERVTSQEEIKGEDGQEVLSLTKEVESSMTVVNRRKSTKPVKRLPLNKGELVNKKILRSRKVPSSESPSREGNKFKKWAQKLPVNDVNTPKKRGRKPMVKVVEAEGTSKRRKDEEKQEAAEREGATRKAKNTVASKTPKKEENKSTKPGEAQKRSKDEGKIKQDKKKSKEKDVILKKVQSTMEEDKKEAKENEVKKSPKVEMVRKMPRREEAVIEKKTPAKLEENRKQANDDAKEKQKKRQSKLENIKEKSRNEKVVIAKKTTDKVEENRKRASMVEKSKETSNQEKNKVTGSEEKAPVKKARSKLNEEKEKPDEKKKQFNPQEKITEKKRTDDVQDISIEAKEEENKKKRTKDDDAKNQNGSKKDEKTRKYRNAQLELMISEANKFLSNKNNRRRTVSEGTGTIKRTRSPDKVCISSRKPYTSVPKPVDDSVVLPKSSSKQKDKRSRPLTVYAPVGVHSRFTRGMERCTRSSPFQSKYMKVAVAQVDIDKAIGNIKRRSVVAPKEKEEKKEPIEVQTQLPPSVPPISESPAALETMQLGQVLTPTNGLVADSITPPPKNVDYNFPLMLDKDIPDTECIITSQISNNNEIIVLTGSSTTDNEMEPPKSIISRRKAIIKPPMVTIPRPSYNKAKSPDLFSTCSDLSLPCSQQQNNRSHFEGFKIFGSELRQSSKQRSCLGILERIPDLQTAIVAAKKITPPIEEPAQQQQQHCIEDEDAMFEITSNGTFGNIVRVNSKGELSPVRNKGQSTPPSLSHPKNRITNYLISSNQHANGGPSVSPLDDTTTDPLPKTPKRRKSLSGTVKRSPRSLSGGITGGKSQSTKLTQWLVKNAVVRISDTSQKPLATKRRRLDLSFPDN